MTTSLSRREFLKLGSLGVGGSLLAPVFPPDEEAPFERPTLGRVTTTQVSVFSQPNDGSRIVRQLFRDRIVPIFEELTPPSGPAWNPHWYRIWGGYVHSAHIQLVHVRRQPVVESLPEGGWLGEITVPYSDTRTYSQFDGWRPVYRLYHQTTHWVTGLVEGPDRTPWYELLDELDSARYYVPAIHVRLIPAEELAPISPDVPPGEKRIEVDISRQTLTAFEAGEPVLFARAATGIRSSIITNGLPTETPKGEFNIASKYPSKHMGEARLTDNLEDYVLVGVPWTAFFDPRGYAIHGAFWHNNFGVPMSRGCVNLKIEEAKWLFRWMTPQHSVQDVYTPGFGTKVTIF